RVPRLRTPRRAVRPVRDADRPYTGRRPHDVVLSHLPAGGAGSGGEELVEATFPVEAPELGVSADRPAVDQDLGYRPPERLSEHRLPEGRVVVERDLLVCEPAGVEERLRAHAEAAPARRVDLNPGH